MKTGYASFDNKIALVNRPIVVRYTAQDIKENSFEGELKYFPARVFQRELDHLNGILMDSKAQEMRIFDRRPVITFKIHLISHMEVQ